ncbi:MAG: hypothetical protein NWR36_04860, partial [Opitutales bacterium]|nr:hypothetical protein [Opitutales bacterium]
MRLGKGSAFILTPKGEVVSWLSTKRTDPTTGEAFPELDPKHFSWNSPRGWCPTCRGYGQLFEWMANDEENPLQDHIDDFEDGEACPDCQGARLNPLSRAVRLPLKSKMEGRAPSRPPEPASGNDRALPSNAVSLPELLCLTPSQLLKTLKRIKADKRSKAVLDELLPEIEERMRFMDRVGLDYLQHDRAT